MPSSDLINQMGPLLASLRFSQCTISWSWLKLVTKNAQPRSNIWKKKAEAQDNLSMATIGFKILRCMPFFQLTKGLPLYCPIASYHCFCKNNENTGFFFFFFQWIWRTNCCLILIEVLLTLCNFHDLSTHHGFLNTKHI